MNFEKMTATNLNEGHQYWDECLKMIETAFSYNDEYKFSDDFELLFNKKNSENLFILLDENKKLIAHIGLLKKNLLYKDEKFPALFWGGICTKKQFQGKGVGSNFFKVLLDKFESSAAISILWSDNAKYFSKFGFFEAGTINIYEGNKKSPLNVFSMSSLNDDDRTFILRNYQQMTQTQLCFERNEEDWTRIFNSKSIGLINEKNVLGFVGKGMDLQNIVYEHYSREKNSTLKNSQYSFWDLTPSQSDENSQTIYNGFFKIHKCSFFKEMIEKCTNQEVKILGLHPKLIEFSFDNDIYKLTHKDFLNGIWGPNQIQELYEAMPPLYISGADSI